MASKIIVTQIPLQINKLEYPVPFDPEQVIFVERTSNEAGKAVLKIYWITKEK